MVAILDLDSIAYAIGNGVKLLDETGEPRREEGRFVYREKTEQELQESADEILKSILSGCKATHYIGFIKGSNTTDKRKEVHAQYKENRKTTPPIWWPFVKADLIRRWGAHEANGFEVDDYVNATRLIVPDSIVCAIDKDLLGLEGVHYNWKKQEIVKVTKSEALYKFWSDMITGQSGDSIKGIPGRGVKFVTEFFSHLKEPSSSMYAVYVLGQYIKDFGESEGIYEFYRNYSALKILDYIPLFIPPAPIEVPGSIQQKDRPPESFFEN